MSTSKKLVAVVVIVLIALAVGLLVVSNLLKPEPVAPPVSEPQGFMPVRQVIGKSVEGRDIEAFTYSGVAASDTAAGAQHLLFVGGIHGGYEWNSVLLAYQFMDFLAAPENASFVPQNLIVTVIPSANPDAVFKVVGKSGRFELADVPMGAQFEELKASARFNAHGVDLNRNFDCKWQPESTWRSKTVSAGTAAFSEPEAAAIRDFISAANTAARPISAAIFWHSQANAVYASECKEGILPATLDIMNAYAKASGYAPVKTFDSYAVTGDAEGWLASIGIPAVTVEMATHESIEWDKNLAGVKAVFTFLISNI